MKPRPFVIIPRSCVCSTSAMCAPQGCACGSQAIVIRHDLAEAITSFLELDVCIQAPLNCRTNPLAAAHTKRRHHDVSWHTATQPHSHTHPAMPLDDPVRCSSFATSCAREMPCAALGSFRLIT